MPSVNVGSEIEGGASAKEQEKGEEVEIVMPSAERVTVRVKLPPASSAREVTSARMLMRSEAVSAEKDRDTPSKSNAPSFTAADAEREVSPKATEREIVSVRVSAAKPTTKLPSAAYAA